MIMGYVQLSKMLWYSKRKPNLNQSEEIITNHWELVEVDMGIELAKHDLQDNGDVYDVITGLTQMARAQDAKGVIGVFPAPILGRIFDFVSAMPTATKQYNLLECYVPWQTDYQRVAYRATSYYPGCNRIRFKHVRFPLIGYLDKDFNNSENVEASI